MMDGDGVGLCVLCDPSRLCGFFRGVSLQKYFSNPSVKFCNSWSAITFHSERLGFASASRNMAFMSEKLNVLAVVGSLHRDSVTRTVIQQVAEWLRGDGCAVDVLDFE